MRVFLCKQSTLALLLYLFTLPLYAQISAQVDRQLLSEDETLRLIISAEGEDKDHEPNLDVLDEHFNVLGTSQSSQLQIINGDTRSSKQWQITLHPKHAGDLIVPAIKFGNKSTQVINVKVIGANQLSPQGQDNRTVFVESEIDKTTPYVQEQVILTVRLFHKIQILNGSLTQPEIDNAVVEKIGDDVKGRTEKNGQLYDVIERRYAIFPQQSGTLNIPSIHFEGSIASSQRGQRNNPGRGFFSDPFSMMQGTQTIRSHSEPLKLSVKTIPSDFKDVHWLPAHSLRLQEQWSPEDLNFEVGQAITRTITIIGEGVTSAQLPSIEATEIDKINIYPDQSAQENRDNENGVLGLMQQKLALLPNEAGNITLPEIRIPWWNTQTNRYEVASLPAKEIIISPSSKAPSKATPEVATLPAQQPIKTNENTDVKSTNNTAANYWPWLTGIFFILWLITSFLWQKQRALYRNSTIDVNRKTHNKKQSLNHLKKELRNHCHAKNATATRTSLIQWAQHYWPNNSILNLGDIISLCGDNDLSQQIKQLDNVLYTQNINWQGEMLYQSFESWLTTASTTKHNDNITELPRLYNNH